MTHGNGFTGYFGLLARIAPFGEHEGRLVLRVPFSRARRRASGRRGMLAFVAVMLGSVGFDGLSRASFWQNLRADLEGPYIVDAPRHGGAHLDRAGDRRPGRLHPPGRARLPRRDRGSPSDGR